MSGSAVRRSRGGLFIALLGVLAVVVGCGAPDASGPRINDLNGPAATVVGAGSTFDEPFFARAFARYHQINPRGDGSL